MNGSNRKERVMETQRNVAKPSTANGAGHPIARTLLAIAVGILALGVIVQGESWAIREAPRLIAQTAPVYSPNAGCVPDDHPDDGVLTVAILH
jgi:hypothetical protein